MARLEAAAGIARLETMAGRFAEAMRREQIRLPQSFASLDEIPALRVTASGRHLEPIRLTRHPGQPRLVKIGLSGDIVPDTAVLGETRARLVGQRSKNDVGSKIKRYLLTPDRYKLARIAGYAGARLRARRAPPFGAAAAGSDKSWALVPGVNFWQGTDGLWRCSDHGAIYEALLTSHAVRYPSQVGTDLYTNSCAAALFRAMIDRAGTTDPASLVWTEALAASACYFAGLRQHPRQRLESDHREFDFGPLYLAFGAETAAASAGWTNYDPVNVYGLRYFNDSLVGCSSRRRMTLSVLKQNQSNDGLLRDNFSGNAVASADLTYHQYALAMLCLGNARVNDPRADKIIEKALICSATQLLSNGEGTYYGRGANNIYHLASLATALCYGAARLGFDTAEALSQVLTRLEAFQRDDGFWPTAMNQAEPGEMIGWHGSNSQYGALSAFLLCQGAGLLANPSALPVRPLPRLGTDRTPGQTVLRGHGMELALTAGGGPIPWSQGLHNAGFAGMAALVAGGRNIVLANDAVTVWGHPTLLAADLQNQTPLDRRRLTREGPDCATLTISGTQLSGRFRYALGPDGVTVSARTNTGTVANHALALIGRCQIVNSLPNTLLVASDAGFTVEVRVEGNIKATLTPIPVNPQGPGTLLCLAAQGPAADFHYRITGI